MPPQCSSWGGVRPPCPPCGAPPALIVSEDGTQEYSEYNCPLVKARKEIRLVESTRVLTDLSVAHLCDASCTFVKCSTRRVVEREEVTCSDRAGLVLKHDFTNRKFYVNVYALSYTY